MGGLEVQLLIGLFFFISTLPALFTRRGENEGIPTGVIVQLVAGLILILMAMFHVNLLAVVR